MTNRKPRRFPDAHLLPTHNVLVTKWRIPHFKDEEMAIKTLQAIESERKRIGLGVIAYGLMPDHLHFLIAPAPMRLGLVVQALKVAVVGRLMADGLTSGTIWQDSFVDVGMRDTGQLAKAIDYVHNNPAKAGLVEDPLVYPYSSYAAWEGKGSSIIQLVSSNTFTLY